MNATDPIQSLDRAAAQRSEAVKAMLIEAGRQDLADDLDRKLRDIRLGTDSARSIWHSISAAQRRVLEIMEPGRWLVRQTYSREGYDAHGQPHAEANVCRAPTVRNLLARKLIEHESHESEGPNPMTPIAPRIRHLIAEVLK